MCGRVRCFDNIFRICIWLDICRPSFHQKTQVRRLSGWVIVWSADDDERMTGDAEVQRRPYMTTRRRNTGRVTTRWPADPTQSRGGVHGDAYAGAAAVNYEPPKSCVRPNERRANELAIGTGVCQQRKTRSPALTAARHSSCERTKQQADACFGRVNYTFYRVTVQWKCCIITDRVSVKCNAISRVRLSVRLFHVCVYVSWPYHARDWKSRSYVKVKGQCPARVGNAVTRSVWPRSSIENIILVSDLIWGCCPMKPFERPTAAVEVIPVNLCYQAFILKLLYKKISSEIWQWKNFENRSRFTEVVIKGSSVLFFWDTL